MLNPYIKNEWIDNLIRSESETIISVSKQDPGETISNYLNSYRVVFDNLVEYFGSERLKNAKILEIGSGNGLFLCFAIINGYNIVGVEPGMSLGFYGRLDRIKSLLHDNNVDHIENYLINCWGEYLPLKDNTFDIIVNSMVMEHVQNIELVTNEAIRVLKPNGIIKFSIPNYHSFYEGHYKAFWIPFFTKDLSKMYVKFLLKRDPEFINDLNFTSPHIFELILERINIEYRFVHHGLFPFSPIFALFRLIENYPNIVRDSNRFKNLIMILFKYDWIRYLLKPPLKIIIYILRLMGFSFAFDLIITKRRKYES